MRFTSFATALAALSLCTGALAQAAPEFSAERFRSHVAFLSDDLLEGRSTGERGHEIAARYVATQLEGLGLKPGVKGGWFQQVPFVKYSIAEAPSGVTIAGRRFPHGGDVIVSPTPLSGAAAVEAPVVFAGYGLDAPDQGFDDYAGLDVKGKVVAVLSGFPQGTPSELGAHLNSEKQRMAEKRGALALVTIPTRSRMQVHPWSVALHYAGEPSMTWINPDGQPFVAAPRAPFGATLNTPAGEALFAGTRTSLAHVLDEAARDGGRPKGFALGKTVRIERQSSTRKLASPNVIGLLPGSDPALAGEYVLLMAHLDHLGVESDAKGDKVHNGAMDNATGIATLLEVARAIMAGPRPRRPILFAAVTGEEQGLLGSQYLSRHPVADKGKVVGVVNLDMPILTYDFTDVVAFGSEHSSLGPIVERAGRGMNVALAPDPLPEQGLFTRSDHYRFVQQGVPSVFLMTGFSNGGGEKFKHFLATDYHKVSDEIGLPFNWQAGAKFARLNYLIAQEIANAPEAPRWYQGDFFGDTFAPGQPRAVRPR